MDSTALLAFYSGLSAAWLPGVVAHSIGAGVLLGAAIYLVAEAILRPADTKVEE